AAGQRPRGPRDGHGLSGGERRAEARALGELDREDAGPGKELLDSRGDAGEEPAAADRDDDRVGVSRIFGDLETDRAGPGENDRIVEGMDERQASRLPDLVQPVEERGAVV